MLQPKETDWLNGYKNKIYISVSKSHTSNLGTHTDWKWGDGKGYSMEIEIKRKWIFFNLSPRVMEIKAKVNKWDLIKLKNFCTAKKTINTTKIQSIEWEKIFANDVTDKRFVSKIYKKVVWLNIIKTSNPIQKMDRRLIWTFFQRKHSDGQESHEKMFNITNY